MPDPSVPLRAESVSVDTVSKDRVREFFTHERSDGSLAVNEVGVGYLDEDEIRALAERMKAGGDG